MRRLRAVAVASLSLLATACPSSDGPTGPSTGTPSTPTTPTTPSTPSTPTTPTTPTPPVVTAASVSVTASALAVEVGKSAATAATVRDANGNALTGRTITWTSSATSVATVDAAGTVRGVAPGVATITAEVDGRTASVTLTVFATPVGNVVLSATTSTVTGTPSVSSGLASLACTFQWRVAMTGTGTATAVENAYTVQAPGGAPTTRTEAIASSTGGALTFSATSGITFTKSLSWQALSGSAAAQAGFTMTLALTYTDAAGARHATAPIVLSCVPPASAAVAVSVSPATATLTVGQTQALAATVTNALNTGVTWSSSAPSVATVSASGLVTAVAAGTATITATSAADVTKSASAIITVGSSTPTTPGTPSGSVSFASVRTLTPPGLASDDKLYQMTATNAGLYLWYTSDTRDRVFRLENGGSLTSGWITYAPSYGLASFTPMHLTLEQPGSFAGYFIQSLPTCLGTITTLLGTYVINTGTPSSQWTNDVCATTIIPSSSEQVDLRHSWLVGRGVSTFGGFYVEQAAKSGNALSGSYKKVAPLIDYTGLATSPKDNALWVGATGKLYEITESGTTRTYDLSQFGAGFAEALRFDGATLWFEYGGHVMRYQNGAFRQYAETTTMPGVPSFCVRGSTIYLTGGTRVDATTGVARTYLADREMAQITSQTDVAAYLALLQKAVGMIECSTAGSSTALYFSTGTAVYEVTPK